MIDPKDYTEQRKIYLRNGGLWRVIGYCEDPSITMENIQTGEREHFGIGGATNATFTPLDKVTYNHTLGRVEHEEWTH